MTNLKSNTSVSRLAGKYLTFALGDGSYGIPVLKVREIIRLGAITSVPQVPAHIRGVINLRGKIIPVIDLRLKFGLGEKAAGESACIVVVQVVGVSQQSIQLGLAVDGVEEVCHFGEEDIEETPDFGSALEADCILGMAKAKGIVKTLLDIDRVLCGNALEEIMTLTSEELKPTQTA